MEERKSEPRRFIVRIVRKVAGVGRNVETQETHARSPWQGMGKWPAAY
jgi:hypothetical protein